MYKKLIIMYDQQLEIKINFLRTLQILRIFIICSRHYKHLKDVLLTFFIFFYLEHIKFIISSYRISY